MKFRRIYWVTEQFDESGLSEVTGVFTSIPDLIELGLGIRPVSAKGAGYRVSLVALDSIGAPLLQFGTGNTEKLEEELEPLVADGELEHEQVLRLCSALRSSV